jgi:hypothetical protein
MSRLVLLSLFLAPALVSAKPVTKEDAEAACKALGGTMKETCPDTGACSYTCSLPNGGGIECRAGKCTTIPAERAPSSDPPPRRPRPERAPAPDRATR